MTQDKKPVRNLKKVCNFRYLPPDTIFPPEKVTSVCAVPFMEDGQIVVVKLDRGWDIAGGHAQEGEVDFIETAKREAMEEGYMTIKDVCSVAESSLHLKNFSIIMVLRILSRKRENFVRESIRISHEESYSSYHILHEVCGSYRSQ